MEILGFVLGVTRTNKIKIYMQCKYITGTVQDEWLGAKVRGEVEIVWTGSMATLDKGQWRVNRQAG